MLTEDNDLAATDAGAFAGMLRRLQLRSGVPASTIAQRAGIPRSQTYALIRLDRTVLPTQLDQVVAFAQACGLTTDKIERVKAAWIHLQEKASPPAPADDQQPAPLPAEVDAPVSHLAQSPEHREIPAVTVRHTIADHAQTGKKVRLSFDAVHELNDLRRGRGVNTASLGSRVGPRLRLACAVDDLDTPAQIRRKVAARLSALCAELPEDLRLAASVALALHDEDVGEFLDRRIAWLAEHFDRDPRTARRRVDTAFRLLGERIEDESTSGDELRTPDGWYVESLNAVLLLDQDPAQLIEERRIVATVEGLSEIAVSLRAPLRVSEPGELVEATVTYGGEIVATQHVDAGHTRFRIRLSETLRLGQRHDYGIRFHSYPRSWTQPYDLLAPLDRCEHFAVRVRFGGETQPDLVWQLRREGMSYGVQFSA